MVNISWHDNEEVVTKALSVLKKAGVKRGINYVYNNSNKRYLAVIRKLGLAFDAEILFLSYKAVQEDWKEVILPNEVFRIAQQTSEKGVKVVMD